MNQTHEQQRQRLIQVLQTQLLYEQENTEKLKTKIKQLQELTWTNEPKP